MSRVGRAAVDWIRIASRVPASEKAALAAFRAKHETLQAALSGFPEERNRVDWAYYKERIQDKTLVEKFEKEFAALSVPYPADKESSKIAQAEKEAETEAQETINQAKQNVIQLQKELHEIKAQKSFEDMTADEYLQDKPELRKEIDEHVKSQQW
ncbi:ATP synthase subunit d, mitochondrial-like [Oscarella lobularis]|uniref:ATP synthase subunit d, mitochondrial-like n=1 Tax=Oscarella lobularis TaxID=121494 RepID=UPI003313775F